MYVIGTSTSVAFVPIIMLACGTVQKFRSHVYVDTYMIIIPRPKALDNLNIDIFFLFNPLTTKFFVLIKKRIEYQMDYSAEIMKKST